MFLTNCNEYDLFIFMLGLIQVYLQDINKYYIKDQSTNFGTF